MTRRQFREAAERNGFQIQLMWLYCAETSTGYGMTIDPKTGRVFHRASLAKAIKQRDADLKKRAALSKASA